MRVFCVFGRAIGIAGAQRREDAVDLTVEDGPAGSSPATTQYSRATADGYDPPRQQQ